MKLTCLLENTSSRSDLEVRHGLSLYLETNKHTILFDFGPDEAFLRNAKVLGKDISSVEMAFLSHGHYDHGGGLSAFLNANDHASVYLHRDIFRPHWSTDGRYIGLNPEQKDNPRLHFCTGVQQISEDLTVISGASGKRMQAASNLELLMEHSDGTRTPDTFSHEQSLIVREGNCYLLVAGCAHSGILNILEQAHTVIGRAPDYVVSGFHLCQPTRGIDEDPAVVAKLGQELLLSPTTYFTCHCTGLNSYRVLKETMRDSVSYLAAGTSIILHDV